MKKNKIENFTSLMNYINEYDGIVYWFDIVQFALDYQMYNELYLNHFMIKYLIEEHNQRYISGEWVKPV